MGRTRTIALILVLAVVAASCGDGGEQSTDSQEGFPWVDEQRQPTEKIHPDLDALEFANGNTRQNPCPDCGQQTTDNDITSKGAGTQKCDHPVAYVENQLISADQPVDGTDITPTITVDTETPSPYELPNALRLWAIPGDPIDYLADNPGFEGWPNYIYQTAPRWKFSPADKKVVLDNAEGKAEGMLIKNREFAEGRVIVIDDFSSGSGHGQFIVDLVEQLTGIAPPFFDVQVHQIDSNDDIIPWPHTGDTLSVAAAVAAAGDVEGDGILNMSLGTYACEFGGREIQPTAVLDEIRAFEIRTVAATGNDSHGSSDPVFYPAGFDEVTGVGALGWDPVANQWFAADFSNLPAAEVWAPGVAVVAEDGNDIVAWSGSSFAAPHYAACIAAGMCQ